jgi:hypothetical protein
VFGITQLAHSIGLPENTRLGNLSIEAGQVPSGKGDIMVEIWKYTESIDPTVKHLLGSQEAYSSLCGKTIIWWGGHWRDDVEGLNQRRACKRCLKLQSNNS